jgi:hypothetical protein
MAPNGGGWERKLSKSTGSFYWVNSVTNETTWELDSEMLEEIESTQQMQKKPGGGS